ncbi:HWE histidine kinase domain-containing protein [Enterovirga aerilata]|uniref:Blue-light-activated histidine kinase n=1 Tax=Enterovirga aerilata TaxID=2730920 RepID=A0A849IE10_9HYPH|nr:HWE histidine kinase domain-containing protein [Enterovirga sp. DB1703]NNM74217.1 GAF domain-containing protein [Enterovirga sp. DB1703]
MDENARVAALAAYDILDTPPERDFDEVARLASQICDTPIAVVNLISRDRQFFKAEVGLGVRSTPLESSFCAKAILEQDFLLVPDATKDPRFDCNPLVTGEPGLRFYAGALLRTEDGYPIGTVCVLDFKPRTLAPVQERTLRTLARQVMKQLDLRKALASQAAALRRLEESEARSRLAQEAGRIGTFEVDVATGVVTVSPEFCRLFGLPVTDTFPAASLEGLVIPEDRGLPSTVTTRRDGSAARAVEYRIRRADDGRQRWIERRAQFTRDEAGQVVQMFGTVRDITQRKTLQIQQAALLELGDRLREAKTAGDVTSAAAEILGRTLNTARAAYLRSDIWAERSEVAFGDDQSERAAEARPCDFADHLARGETVARDGVESAVEARIDLPVLANGKLAGVISVQADGRRRWTADEVDFARGIADRVQSGLAKVQAEADQAVLNAELGHRLKNTLALVQAIAAQTLRGVTEREAVEAFLKRIHAVAAAHDVLLQQSWASARMKTVAGAVLSAFGVEERFEVSGPDIALSPRVTLSFSMLLHELATNALKYGALSSETGRVRLAWRVTGCGNDAELALDWAESGGPPAQEPTRRGFGSRLIRMGLIGTGGTQVRYLPSGLEAAFRAPLAYVQHS